MNIVSILISLLIFGFVLVCTLCFIQRENEKSLSTYGFSDLEVQKSARRREILQRSSFLLLIVTMIFIFHARV